MAPRYIGPYQIVAKMGKVAYQLELPEQLSDVHDVFHMLQLKKCLRVPKEQARLEDIELGKDLAYAEHPVEILEVVEKQTRNRVYRLCKVRWSNHTEGEATWEREDLFKAEYPPVVL